MKSPLAKLSALSALLILSPLSCKSTANAQDTTTAEKPSTEKTDMEAGWHNLIEGNQLNQWRSWRRGDIKNAPAWTVKDGILHLSKSPENKNKGGSIITLKQYPNFELKFEFNIAQAGNSGIKYRSLDNLGLEYQVLDDKGSKEGKNPKNTMASLYQLVAAAEDKPLKPAGEWNSGRIVANGKQIQHWLNGVKVVEIEIDSDEWKAAFAKSKYKDKEGFAKQSAEILLQDHGAEVSYRNLLIKELK